MSTPAIVHGWFSGPSDVAILPSEPNQMSAMLCSRNATANVATNMTAGDCVRNGRKTRRSISIDSTSTTAKQSTIESQVGRFHCDPSASAKAPAITSWPYAKLTRRSTPNTSPIPIAISA